MNKNIERQRKVIIGLGNPGKEYERTRHNVGFMFIDYLLGKHKDIHEKKLKNSIVYEIEKNLILAKPQTFMNKSGLAVKEIVKWFDVDIKKELIIVHDDLDIPLSKFKLQTAKSPRDHNGIRSVEDHLGTVDFLRLRIGIDNRGGKEISGEKYVLENFKSEELATLQEVFEQVVL